MIISEKYKGTLWQVQVEKLTVPCPRLADLYTDFKILRSNADFWQIMIHWLLVFLISIMALPSTLGCIVNTDIPMTSYKYSSSLVSPPSFLANIVFTHGRYMYIVHLVSLTGWIIDCLQLSQRCPKRRVNDEQKIIVMLFTPSFLQTKCFTEYINY